MAQAKLPYQTNKGRAQYPWLTSPDTKYDSDGVYHTSLIVPADQAKAIIDQVKEFAKDEMGKKAQTAQMPFKSDPVTGEIVFTAKTKFEPKFYDSSGAILVGNKIPKLYRGSVLKLGGNFTIYDLGSNHGVKMNLSKVQVIELGDPNQDDSEGFDAVEGGFIAQAVAADTFDDSGDADGEASSNYNF